MAYQTLLSLKQLNQYFGRLKRCKESRHHFKFQGAPGQADLCFSRWDPYPGMGSRAAGFDCPQNRLAFLETQHRKTYLEREPQPFPQQPGGGIGQVRLPFESTAWSFSRTTPFSMFLLLDFLFWNFLFLLFVNGLLSHPQTNLSLQSNVCSRTMLCKWCVFESAALCHWLFARPCSCARASPACIERSPKGGGNS